MAESRGAKMSNQAVYLVEEVKWTKLIFLKSDGMVDRVILPKDLQLMSNNQVQNLMSMRCAATNNKGAYRILDGTYI